jgi:hypothetical protein
LNSGRRGWPQRCATLRRAANRAKWRLRGAVLACGANLDVDMRGLIKKRVAQGRLTWSLGIAVTGLIAIFTSPGTTFAQCTAPVNVTAAGLSASDPSVAVADNGSAVFAWHHLDGANKIAEARTLSAAGVLAQVHPLPVAGQSGSDTDVAVDANGNAIIT